MINTQMANCSWNGLEGQKKFHLANWPLVSIKKEFGGLGIRNIHDLNICLLVAWIKLYACNEDKIWKTIIDKKIHTLP